MLYARAMTLRFTKYEALQNDFVVVDGDPADRRRAQTHALEICDRRRGVGADGLLLVDCLSRRMVVVNADGSNAQMCGNGLRCVALHLVRTGVVKPGAFTVETAAGPHRCEMMDDGQVTVHMLPANLAPAAVPVVAEASLIDAAVVVQGRPVHVTAVSMGNPHIVTFDDFDEDARRALGPLLAADPRFPEGVNVGFAVQRGPEELHLDVLERGAGWTYACGTGACAAAVAAVVTGRMPRRRDLTVHLPGGSLQIRVGADTDPVRMSGPARHVFDGVYDG